MGIKLRFFATRIQVNSSSPSLKSTSIISSMKTSKARALQPSLLHHYCLLEVVVAKVFSCLQVLFSSMVQADLGGVPDSHLRPKLLSCCPSIAGGHQKLPNPGSQCTLAGWQCSEHTLTDHQIYLDKTRRALKIKVRHT